MGCHIVSFHYDNAYIPSKENVFADALSRLPLPTMGTHEDELFNIGDRILDSLPVTAKEVRHATSVDPVLSRVLEFTRNGWPLKWKING